MLSVGSRGRMDDEKGSLLPLGGKSQRVLIVEWLSKCHNYIIGYGTTSAVSRQLWSADVLLCRKAAVN